MKNHVKITSGSLRGRIIATPGEGTHPMGERERLALFNMVSEDLHGARVLDAYAGSGALGIESLSRGAREVVFVEASHRATKCIIKNLMTLGFARTRQTEEIASKQANTNSSGFATLIDDREETATVICSRVQDYKPEQSFDVVLADPPYDDFRPEGIKYLGRYLKEGGVMVLSHPGEAPILEGLVLLKSRHYAGATISIFTKR